jgi:hypothetical protein
VRLRTTSTSWSTRAVAASVLVAIATLAPALARAQAEESVTRRTAHFSFVYRRRYEPVIDDVIDAAEAMRRQIMADLGARERGQRIEVRFARNVEEMRAISPRQPPAYADAVAFSPEDVIAISLTTTRHNRVSLVTVLRHELTHLVLRWVVGEARVPRWFNEGLAIVESDELAFERLKLLWPSVASGELTPLSRIDRSFPSRDFDVNRAYAESGDVVRFLTTYEGEWRVRELLQRLGRGEPFYEAMESTWGQSVRELEHAWHLDLQRRFSVMPTVTAGMTLWVAVGLMAVLAYVKRRRDVTRRIAAMPDEDEEAEGA